MVYFDVGEDAFSEVEAPVMLSVAFTGGNRAEGLLAVGLASSFSSSVIRC